MRKGSVYKKYIFGEMSKIKECNIDHLEDFVNSLNYDQARILCKYLSYNRKNNVYDYVSKGPDHWKVNDINISDIYVEKVNPLINPYLERNNWSLEKIADDKDISFHEEFQGRDGTGDGTIDNRLMVFIAKKVDHKYRIVDGIHRVIRLGCDRKKKFKLIYY